MVFSQEILKERLRALRNFLNASFVTKQKGWLSLIKNSIKSCTRILYSCSVKIFVLGNIVVIGICNSLYCNYKKNLILIFKKKEIN